MLDELISIGEAAKFLGVTEKTIRLWEVKGKIIPAERTEGGHRRYLASEIRKMVGVVENAGLTVADEYDEYMKDERAAVANEMQKKLEFIQMKGYLGKGEEKDKNLANILSNYLDLQSTQVDTEDCDYNLKLIKMIWNKLLTRDLITYQVMGAPTGLIFYMTEKVDRANLEVTRCIESDAVAARTRKYGCDILFPGKVEREVTVLEPETFVPSKKSGWIGAGLKPEACLEINSRNMAADIDGEIIEDLLNNSTRLPGDWKDEIMCNLSHRLFPGELRGIVTNEVGLRLMEQDLTSRLSKFPIIDWEHLPNRLMRIGEVGVVPLYYHPKVNKFLLIRRGESEMQSGYFYCPYIFFNLTPMQITGDKIVRGGLIRYGKKLVRTGGRYYQAFEF